MSGLTINLLKPGIKKVNLLTIYSKKIGLGEIMKIMSIFGTRPEMIKMWSTLKMLDELDFHHVMVHGTKLYS